MVAAKRAASVATAARSSWPPSTRKANGTLASHFDPAAGSGHQSSVLSNLAIQTDQLYDVALAQTQAPSRSIRVYWTPGLLGIFEATALDGGTVIGQSVADGHSIVTPVDRSPRLRAVVGRPLRGGWSPASIAILQGIRTAGS